MLHYQLMQASNTEMQTTRCLYLKWAILQLVSLTSKVSRKYLKDLDNMWPIFEPTKIEVCRFDLPSFILPSNSALIKIGKFDKHSIILFQKLNSSNVGKRTDLAIQYFKYIPFSHCRNTKFYCKISIL